MSYRQAFAIVAAAFVAISLYTAHIQKIVLIRFGDGDEYQFAAEHIAAGQTIRAELPYAHRIALPWLVAKTFPTQVELGFKVYNTAAAAASVALLFFWLKSFGVHPGIAALTTILFTATWIGPTRFNYYFPINVDPPYIALAMGALMLIRSLRRGFSWARMAALSAVCFIGSLVRQEAMLFPALAFLFANVRFAPAEDGEKSVPWLALVWPLAFVLLGFFAVRQIHIEPRRVIAHENIATFLRNKPLFTLPLSFFLTFVPVIAVVAYDWRLVRDMIAKHAYLFVFMGCVFVTSYIGGHENERYLVWGAPVMYLLIALALERHAAALLRNAVVFVALVIAQIVSAHILTPIPDPSLAVGDWKYLTTAGEKAWGALNRLFVIDDFAWNIWSYFGSPQFHMLLLGMYVAFSACLMTYLWWAERSGTPNLSNPASGHLVN